MKRRTFITLLIVFSLYISCTSQKGASQARQNKAKDCKGKWTYVSLPDTVSGIIIFYEQPIIHCGVVSTASVALIRINSGKVVTVLSLCNIKKDSQSPNQFEHRDSVIVGLSKPPGFRVDLIPIDPEACTLKYAYFGTIFRTKKSPVVPTRT